MSYINATADVQSEQIGEGTRVWQYVVILPNARIGKDCNICSHCFIENDVVIGDRVTVKNGVFLYDGIRIDDDAFIGPGVIFTNDIFPRSRLRPQSYPITIVKSGSSIGGGSIILPGITIGYKSMVGAGAVVTKSVPDNSIVHGNPAKVVGYIDD